MQPGRIAIPTRAGTIDPATILRGVKRSQFLDVNRRVDLSLQACLLPQACYRVEKDCERKLREMLLESEMAVLIEDAAVPRTHGGYLLLSGLFTVPHKDHVDRLIFDGRPQNFCEARLGWAALPLGSQFCRLVLNRCQAPLLLARAEGGTLSGAEEQALLLGL